MVEGIYGPNLISQNPVKAGTETEPGQNPHLGLTGSQCIFGGLWPRRLAVLYCWQRDGKFITLQIIPFAA